MCSPLFKTTDIHSFTQDSRHTPLLKTTDTHFVTQDNRHTIFYLKPTWPVQYARCGWGWSTFPASSAPPRCCRKTVREQVWQTCRREQMWYVGSYFGPLIVFICIFSWECNKQCSLRGHYRQKLNMLGTPQHPLFRWWQEHWWLVPIN